MKPNSKDNPIIGRAVKAIIDIEDFDSFTIKKGTIGIITQQLNIGLFKMRTKSGAEVIFDPIEVTDEFPVRITHYECIKDGKIILSSNEPIETESIEEFKENAKRLIQCDTVNVEFEKIGE